MTVDCSFIPNDADLNPNIRCYSHVIRGHVNKDQKNDFVTYVYETPERAEKIGDYQEVDKSECMARNLTYIPI